MTTTTTLASGEPASAATRPAAGRRPFGRRARRALLVVHIWAGGAWIGIDVLVAVLVLTGRFAGDVDVRSLAYEALATFVVAPMLTAGLTTLTSGLLLGLGTKWGLLRYWWVAVKLVLTVVLCTLIVVALQPGMAEVSAYGQDLVADAPVPRRIDSLFFPPAVSLTTLTFLTVLGVAKPWGRLRRARRR